MVQKRFTCEYFQVTNLNEHGREELFDLLRWIDNINVDEYYRNTRNYKEDKIRIENIHYHETYRKFFLRFMRQRIADNPSLSSDNFASDFMELDDQYVSEDVSCLYDEETHVLMIQKNYHSASPLGIQLYINELWNGTEEIILRKVVSRDSFLKARQADSYRKIQIRVADLPTVRRSGRIGVFGSIIGNSLRAMDNYEMPNVEFTFSVGKKRNADLGDDLANPIINDIENYPECFDRAKIQLISQNEVKSEFVDLILDSMKDEIIFEVERNNPIRFEAMMDKLGFKYCPGEEEYFENRKDAIDRCLMN